MRSRAQQPPVSPRPPGLIRRRSFVGGLPLALAALATASPFWNRLLGRALAQELGKQRLLVWYTADGTVPEWYWPSEPGALSIRSDRTNDLSGSTFNTELPESERPSFLLQPIADYADRMLMVRGIDGPGQGDHAPAVRSLLTGEALSGEEARGSTPSLDVVVSELLMGPSHVEPVFRTGVYGNRVSYEGTRDLSRPREGDFVEPSWQPVSDARRVLDAVGGLETSDEGTAVARASRLAILGSVRERVEALRCAAGSRAAERLEAYVEEVARLERLETELRDAPATEPLVDPEDPAHSEAQGDIRRLSDIAPFVRDLTVTALALDYAPVATIQWGASGENKIQDGRLTDHRYDFLADLEYPGAGDHGLAHPEDGAFQEAGHRITAAVSTRDRVRIQRWFYGQLRALLDRLASIPDGAGTLLDTTTVLCVSEFGGPNANSTAAQHSLENLPFLLIGGSATPFRTGQFIQTSANHGDYHLTIARGFGSDADSHGVGTNLIDGILL